MHGARSASAAPGTATSVLHDPGGAGGDSRTSTELLPVGCERALDRACLEPLDPLEWSGGWSGLLPKPEHDRAVRQIANGEWSSASGALSSAGYSMCRKRRAFAMASSWECAPRATRIARMWLRTVTSTTPRRVAMTLAGTPSARSCSTSCCRAVSSREPGGGRLSLGTRTWRKSRES